MRRETKLVEGMTIMACFNLAVAFGNAYTWRYRKSRQRPAGPSHGESERRRIDNVAERRCFMGRCGRTETGTASRDQGNRRRGDGEHPESAGGLVVGHGGDGDAAHEVGANGIGLTTTCCAIKEGFGIWYVVDDCRIGLVTHGIHVCKMNNSIDEERMTNTKTALRVPNFEAERDTQQRKSAWQINVRIMAGTGHSTPHEWRTHDRNGFDMDPSSL
ncbi:Aste57867_22908 [Aphanomyces stellatus]|uniref:Aste57867_22908 protein n=1 Tax=Aphanomyces stellatus TaxID=120398 RepID=A0A485LMW5_9STRA|nr:hypothetical protein As57867_022837 [Aphanomyces stellatus]VFT99558.1 Aste57867_22908 [Aphanomyces stellatus]